VVVPVALAAVLLGGCGGNEQTHGEPTGSFPVKIVKASFPSLQAVAHNARMSLTVRNTGVNTMPNVAVTVDSFSYTSSYPGLADNQRPVWIVNTGPGAIPKRPVQSVTVDPPGGGQTAFVNTWALGPLRPGRTRTFTWHVTPVKGGVHTITYVVSAGLNGKARAHVSRRSGVVEGEGGAPVGHIKVGILGRPPQRYVNPETGKVTHGSYPPGRYSQ
jgi:hypothetical protein